MAGISYSFEIKEKEGNTDELIGAYKRNIAQLEKEIEYISRCDNVRESQINRILLYKTLELNECVIKLVKLNEQNS